MTMMMKTKATTRENDDENKTGMWLLKERNLETNDENQLHFEFDAEDEEIQVVNFHVRSSRSGACRIFDSPFDVMPLYGRTEF